jgi:hypothetical protein
MKSTPNVAKPLPKPSIPFIEEDITTNAVINNNHDL